LNVRRSIEMDTTEKNLNSEIYMDFTGIELMDYLRKYDEEFLQRHSSISKKELFEIIGIIEKLSEEKILKKINYDLLLYIMKYQYIYDYKFHKQTFENFLITALKVSGKEWT
jgi:hypothetical protein